MRRILHYLPLHVVCFFVSLTALGQVTQTNTYNYTGGVQSFTVPVGVTSVTVDVQGAQGGDNTGYGNNGGDGARVQSTLDVTAGDVLNIYVGGAGQNTDFTSGAAKAGGFNGGANGGTGVCCGGAGGGGASDIRIGGTALSNRQVVAGGGGGAGGYGVNASFGIGGFGGFNGQAGANGSTPAGGGGGGTQTSGGAGGAVGVGTAGSAGGLASGGIGGNGTNNGGGGGGGGYYGGGGGGGHSSGSYSGGGGGGSSFSSGSSTTYTSGFRAGNGIVSVSYLTPCSPTYGSACSSGDYIDDFSTSGGTTNISNLNTGCGGASLIDYTNQVHTAAFGTTVSFSLQSGPTWPQGYSIWVDWDQDNVYEADELMWSSATSTTAVVTGSFDIPFAIAKTSYRMRVRAAYNVVPTDPCANYAFGETEEYTISVTSPYCSPTFTSGCGLGDFINNFSTSGGVTNITNNGTGCNGTVVDFTDLVHTVYEDSVVNFTVQSGSAWDQGFGIWVDYNHDGVFAAGEQVWNSGSSSTAPFTGSFTIPCQVDLGNTIMRVVAAYSTVPTSACGSYSHGEAEEYTLRILEEQENPSTNAFASINVSLDQNGAAYVDTTTVDSGSSDNCGIVRSRVAFSIIDGYEDQVQYLGAYNGHSYFLTNTTMTKATAQTLATNMGGYLAAITSAAENDIVQEFITPYAVFPFIGLNDATTEGTFVWESGEAFSYSNWSPGEPNNVFNEDCVQFYYTTGFWNDVQCGNAYTAIIEINDTMEFSDRVMFSCADTGTSTVYLSTEDARGNQSADYTSVTVSDNTGPEITAANFTLYLDSNGMAVIPDSLLDGSTPQGNLYFTATNGNRIWVYNVDSAAPVIVRTGAAASSIGPTGIDYSSTLDSVYYGGGNNPYIYRSAADGSGSVYSLPNANNLLSIFERHEVDLDEANNRFFFTAGDDGVFVANMDGTGSATNLFNPTTSGGVGLDYDASSDLLLYGDVLTDLIQSMRADGSNYQVLYNSGDGVSGPRQVVTDGKTGKVFWANRSTNSIMVGAMDGSTAASTLYTGQNGIYGIEYYAPSDMLYWTRFGAADEIYRAPADGTGTPELLFTGNFGGIRGLTVSGLFPKGVHVTDNCGVASFTVSSDTFYCANLGTNTITINASDIHGNTSTGSVDVNVMDTIVPLAAAIDTTIYLDVFGQGSLIADSINNGSYDNCALTFTLSDSTYDCSEVGTNLVWFYATDPSGNVDSIQVTITVEDTIAPDVVTQDITVNLDATGNATIVPGDIDNGSSDACGIASYALDITTFACVDVGTPVTVTLTVTDSNSNAASDTAVVTVLDLVAPTVVTKNITVNLDSFGQATISKDSVDDGSSDACGIATTALSDTTFDCTDVGTPVMVVYTVTDVNGNSDTAHAYVTVLDLISPTVNAVDSLEIFLDASGSYTIDTTELNAGSFDGCGIPTFTIDLPNYDCSDHGTSLFVTLTGTDPSGNSSSAQTYVTITDSTHPTVITQNITVQLDATGNASIVPADVDNGSFDNCGIDTRSLDITTFDCSDVGTPVTVTLTVTDSSGLVDSNTAVVTVEDNVPPVVVTQNITVVLDTFGIVTIANDSVENGSSDACGIQSIVLNDTTFECADVGSPVQIVQTVTDSNGNSDTAHAYVTVLDQTTPAIHAFDSVTVYLDPTGNYTLLAGDIDSASYDACGITFTLDTFNFDCSNHSLPVTVTLTGTDPSGNSSSDLCVVTVLDTVPPTVITQNVTVFLDASGAASITVNDVNNGSNDACGIDTMYIDTANFSCASWNTPITVTLTAIDSFGNIDSATATVTVVDAIAPNAIAQSNHILYLDSSGFASLSALTVDSGSTDNCAIESWVLSDSIFGCGDVGATQMIVLTVTDSSGNSDTAHAYVDVFDTIAPTIVIQNSFVYLDSFGQVVIDSDHVDIGTWDSCGIAFLSIDSTAFDCDYHGDTITTWFYATDVNGNSDSQLVDLWILDTIGPEVITQPVTVALDSNGEASITTGMIDNGSWDSCGISTYNLDTSQFFCADFGANTVNLTVTDIHGNSTTQPATVTVIDTIFPVIIVQDTTIYLDTFGSIVVTPQMVDNGTFDNCSIDTTYVTSNLFTCADIGQTFGLEFTAVDIHGNLSTDSVFITIDDTLPPVLLANTVTLALNSAGNTSLNVGMVDSASFDNCSLDSLWISDTAFTCVDLPGQTIQFFGVDSLGNTDSIDVFITIIDTIAPTVLAQNLTVFLDGTGQFTITADTIDTGSFDNCSVDTIWLDQYTFTCPDTASPNPITLYVQDQSGNVDSTLVTVTVFDTLAPFMFANDLDVYLDSFGNASIVPSQIDSASYDNCAIATTWLDITTFSCADVNNPVTVTLYAVDISGNVDSTTAVVTVLDTIAPLPIVQNLTVALDTFGSATIDSSMVNAGTWDSCGVFSMTLEQDAFDCGDVGMDTLWFYAEDVNGNIDSAQFVITILDTIAPVIAIEDTFYVYLDSSGIATVTADSIDIGTSDACGLESISIDTSTFDCTNHGDTLTVTFTATDSNSNVSTATSIFIIQDTIAPTIYAHGDTVSLDSNGQFVISANVLNDSTQDACGVDTFYISDTLITCATVDSTIQVWFYAQDVYGNLDSLALDIHAIDEIHPELTCPGDIIVDNDSGDCGAIVGFDYPTAWDNCVIDSIVQIDTTGLDSGAFFPVGVTTLRYVAYDRSLNTDTCFFTIEVQDTTAPVLLCQADTQICDTTYIFDLPDYIDNCTGFDVVQVAGIPSGEFYPVGSTINRFAVTDSYGNTDTCEYEVFRYDFPTVADAGPDQEKCEEYEATLDANAPTVGIGTWSLIQGAGSISDTLDPGAEITGLEVGMTLLEWRIENGVCPIERDTMSIEEYLNPVAANAGTDIVLCDTNQGVLGAIPDSIGTGNWLTPSNGTSIGDSSAADAIVSGLEIGDYNYIWRVVNGVCPITYDTVELSVKPYAVVDAGEDEFIFAPSNIGLTAEADLPVSFTWTPAALLVSDTGDSVVATARETTEYIVTAETEFGCRTRDTILVGVNVGPVLPTAFTPDGDNYNDVWNLKELENYPGCVVKVYNRWGHVLFTSNGYEDSWDGTYNGEPLPTGSYFYVIELNVDEVPPQTGSVTIIR